MNNENTTNNLYPCWFCAELIAPINGDPCNLFVDANDGTDEAQVLTCHMQCFKGSLDPEARSNFRLEELLEAANNPQQQEE